MLSAPTLWLNQLARLVCSCVLCVLRSGVSEATQLRTRHTNAYDVNTRYERLLATRGVIFTLPVHFLLFLAIEFVVIYIF